MPGLSGHVPAVTECGRTRRGDRHRRDLPGVAIASRACTPLTVDGSAGARHVGIIVTVVEELIPLGGNIEGQVSLTVWTARIQDAAITAPAPDRGRRSRQLNRPVVARGE